MTARKVYLLRTGTANTASVVAALTRAGGDVHWVESALDLEQAERLVVPGVGTPRAALGRLDADGLREPLVARLKAGRPTLTICLGLQLLAEDSEESPGVAGLGLVRGTVEHLPAHVRVPQLGWNRVCADEAGAPWLTTGHAYFANSYGLSQAPGDGWAVAYTEHGRRFISALAKGGVLACQFHPELSGPWGEALLVRWLQDGTALAGDAPSAAATAQSSGLTRRIIPCLDVSHGRVVKGIRFTGLRDAGDPLECALRYQEQGADELVLLDVSATVEGRAHQLATVARLRGGLSIPLTAGGGVTHVDDALALLEAGADKVSVNTAAVREPALLDALAAHFGRQCTVLAVDARRRAKAVADQSAWEVLVRSGTEGVGRDALAWIVEAVERGAGEILLTSWDRDGTRSGYDLELLTAASTAISVPVIASGGAASALHLAEAFGAGADAVLAASIFHDGETTVAALKDELARDHAIEVRR